MIGTRPSLFTNYFPLIFSPTRLCNCPCPSYHPSVILGCPVRAIMLSAFTMTLLSKIGVSWLGRFFHLGEDYGFVLHSYRILPFFKDSPAKKQLVHTFLYGTPQNHGTNGKGGLKQLYIFTWKCVILSTPLSLRVPLFPL